LIRRTLALRKRVPHLFAEGSYHPVEVEGPSRESVVAFVRRGGADWLLVAVPRLVSRTDVQEGRLAFRTEAWSDTSLRVEGHLAKPVYDVLRGRGMNLSARAGLDRLWGEVPVALLSSVSPD
jgi:(1->4)-alpha-D-glucan 1-alpha-D-glucosylmutase